MLDVTAIDLRAPNSKVGPRRASQGEVRETLLLLIVPLALLVNLRILSVSVLVATAALLPVVAGFRVLSRRAASLSIVALATATLLLVLVYLVRIGDVDQPRFAQRGVLVAARNLAFFSIPAAVLFRTRPRPLPTMIACLAGIALIGSLILVPGGWAAIGDISTAAANADFVSLNFLVFRQAAETWNELLNQPVFPNPGSVKNLLGEICVALLFLSLASGRWPWRRTQAATFITLVVLTLVSQSRAALACLLVVGGLVFFRRLTRAGRRSRFTTIRTGAVVVALSAFFGPLLLARLADEGTRSYESRQQLISFHMSQFLENPAWGTSVPHPSGLPAHVLLVDWSARLGIGGLIAGTLLLGVILEAVRRGQVAYRQTRSVEDLGRLGLAVLPLVRFATTGGVSLSVAASFALGMAVASSSWRRREVSGT